MRTVVGPLAGAALLLVMGFFLWREHGRVRFLEERLAEVQKSRAPASARLTDSVPVPAPRPAARLPDSPTPISSSSATANPTPVSRPFTESERKFRAQAAEFRRWNALAKKADLLAALHLPPDKLAALKDLLVEREYTERDARDAARSADLNANDAAMSETGKIDERIHAMLGDADFAKYAEATGIDLFRQQLEGVGIPGCLVDADAALSEPQKNWLAGLMYRTIQPLLDADKSGAGMRDPTATVQAFHAAALAQAPGNLTESQIAALREFFRKDDEMAMQMNLLIRERSASKQPP